MISGLMAGLAALLGAAAVMLAVPSLGRRGLTGERLVLDRVAARSRMWITAPAILIPLLVVVVDGLHLVLMVVLVFAATAAWALYLQSRHRRIADARQAKVVEVCEALLGELRAGQPLVTCLEHCVSVWTEFEPVVAAGRLGADVPSALRSLSRAPGAAGLAEAAAAWQVSQGSGTGLALALGEVAASARQAEATRHLVRSELSSAQATARLVALLPVAALAMGTGVGADPWHILLDTPLGLACLATGLALAYAGLAWIDRIAATVVRR